MKRIALYLGIVAALVASCSIYEEDVVTPQQDDVIFYASFEQPSEETRVYANENLYLRWTADDRVSIFNKITYNQQYKFLGETGDNSGGFNRVDAAEFVTGNPIPHVVSVYPYQEGTKISEEEVLTLTLPAEQHYAENTFGLGANTMVSFSLDNVLQYKNVGGYLRISLYGAGVSVSSITLKGNNGEKLAGKATVTMPLDGTPTAVLAEDASDEITLVCDAPVALGATAEESVDFWFVVPPMTLSKGFSVSVTQVSSGLYEITTAKSIIIERSNVSKMSPAEVDLIAQPNSVIYYTSADGNVVNLDSPYGFGVEIVSNVYEEGRGTITFDGDVQRIGRSAFFNCKSLTSIAIPKSVTVIDRDAFTNCSGLTSFVIPDSVVSIEDSAFSGCSGLTTISIPDSVESIAEYAFSGTGITSITIPSSVTNFGGNAFGGCGKLTSIVVDPANPAYDSRINCNAIIKSNTNELISGCVDTVIPNSVMRIGDRAFRGCSGLTAITIPYSVTSFGAEAFLGCVDLTSIQIPSSVTSIGDQAFAYCISLTSIDLPNSVMSIGDRAFVNCKGLTSIVIPGSLTSIGVGLFGMCESLTSIVVESGNPVYDSRNNCNAIIKTITDELVATCKNTIIPNSVRCIGPYAFSGCSGLTTIEIPNSVNIIGDHAFYGWKDLISIVIPDSVTSIGSSAFSSCTGLTSIRIPAANIGRWAFVFCTSLTSIELTDSVTSIGDYAFADCTGLTSIDIPSSVTRIGSSAFSNCTGLTSITLHATTPPSLGYYAFFNTNDCVIYVPVVSVDAYRSSWSDYADRIQAISSGPVPDAIDLGLPSGLKWASFNLGASAPEEYGDYYAWGAIEPCYSSLDPLTWKEGKEAGYKWSSYKWCMGSYKTFTKYCTNWTYGYNGFKDGKTVLDPEDDAAHVNLGGAWRMPTKEEQDELLDKCFGRGRS